MHEVEY